MLDSLRIINGEPMVKAGPATKHQKRWHGLPSMFGAASSPASGSKEATLTPPIVKKEDNDGWQTNKKDQCFLWALCYFFHHCYPQYIDLTGDVPKVKMDGASEPATTFMATVPQDLNASVTLQNFQQILDRIAATPYDGVEILDRLQYSREKGATKNDEMLHVQNSILEELGFKESDFNLANKERRLSTCLLVANADLLARLYRREKISDPSPYAERNHMVFLVSSINGELIIKDPNNGSDILQKISVKTIQNLLKTNPTLFEIWVKMTADETEERLKQNAIQVKKEDKMDEG